MSRAILDGHIHMNDAEGALIEVLQEKAEAYQKAGFSGVCLVCDTSAGIHGLVKNMMALLYKWLHSEQKVYVLAGLEYFLPGEIITKQTFRHQAEKLLAAGADGFKMYEGKPNARKQIGNRPLTDECYAGFFSLLEEKQIPIAIHLADPDNFWDPSHCGADAFKRGWFFGDSSYASAETIREEVLTLLRRYPRLKVIIPQLGFLTHRLDRLAQWLEQFPTLTYDLGPTPEFYERLASPDGELKHFLQQYRDRVFFSCTGVCADKEAVLRKAEKHISFLREYLEESDAKSGLWSDNFIKLFGNTHTVDRERCLEYIGGTEKCLLRCPEGAVQYRQVLKRIREIKRIFTETAQNESVNLRHIG